MNLKNGKVFTSKSVGTGPSSYEKRIYRAAVSQKLRNTALDSLCDGPNLHRRGLQRTNMHSINIQHQLHSHFLSPIHLRLILLTLRKNLKCLMAKLVVSLLRVFTTGFIGLWLFFHIKRVLVLIFPFGVYYVSRKGIYKRLVSCLCRYTAPDFTSQILIRRERQL